MVRTYRPGDNYNLVSPWEQAMRNADNETNQQITTGKRMYSDRNVSQLSGHVNTKNIKLPPITDDPQQLQNFLAQETGKILARSKEKLKKIKNEIVLYDPQATGLVMKTSVLEILSRYAVPKDEGSQRKLAEAFQDRDERGKVNRIALMEFLEASKNAGKEELQRLKTQEQQSEQNQQQENFADSQLGRYDSQPSMEQKRHHKAKRGEMVRHAFMERRDAGLLIELEHALEAYATTVNPHDLLDELEVYLENTCKNDENKVDSMHMKSVMDKHRFPINSALIIKCIDRLDPTDTGQIEWPKYIEFLRRAVKNSPRPRQQQNIPIENETTKIPQKPAWENKKPLSSISTESHPHTNGMKSTPTSIQSYQPQGGGVNSNNYQQSGGGLDPNFNYMNIHHESSTTDDYYQHHKRSEEAQDRFYGLYSQQSFSENEPGFDQSFENGLSSSFGNGLSSSFSQNMQQQQQQQQMSDDLESAFVESLQKLRSESMGNGNQSSDMSRRDFGSFAVRGESYKRVADALHDKAKFEKGIISVGEVEKIVNYYNLLFDTNIPMEQVGHVISMHQSNGMIDVKHIINGFGTEIA